MLKNLCLTRPLAFLDAGSTGVNPQNDRVVEIAVLRCAPDRTTVSFLRRLNPGVPIPPSATAVHGIADADVADCCPFQAIVSDLLRFLDGCDLAGYGIKRFDLPLLVAEFRRVGVHFPLAGRAVIDALQIFHQREKRDLQAAFAFYCDGKHDHAHRPDYDVYATALVLDAQLARYRDLPRTVPALHTQLTELDLGGWFRRQSDALVFAIGKHAGRRLADVVKQHPDYIRWMLDQPLLDDTRSIIESAVKRAIEE
jgi:DNA polymerase-3 subunit epsilon